jgi:hypothetical protein
MIGPVMHVPDAPSRPTAPARSERPAQAGASIGSSDATGTHPSVASLRALDWLNFLLAALLMAFGPL